MEEHTLNLMPKAPSFSNFFLSQWTHVHTYTHIYACTHKFTHALLLKHKTQKPGCCSKEIMTVLGRKVIGLHGEPGKKSDVQCIYYA